MIDGISPSRTPSLKEEMNTIVRYLSADPILKHASLSNETILYAMCGPERMTLVRELMPTIRNALFAILVSNGDAVDLTYVKERLLILDKGLELALLRGQSVNNRGIISTIRGISQEDRNWLLINFAKQGQSNVLDLLLDHSTFDNNVCGLAFERACEAGHLATAKLLIKNIPIPDNYKAAAYDKAVRNKHEHIVQHFFSNGSTPYRTYLPMQQSISTKTPVHPNNEANDPLDIVLKCYKVSKL